MRLQVPEFCLIALVGPSGSGKSSFARRHFKPTEVLSSDFFRGLVADDETDQAATPEAFAALHFVAGKRLAAGRLTVIDATNVQPEARKPLVALAREFHTLPVAIVLDMPEAVCRERNLGRVDRTFGPHVIRQQAQQLRRSLKGLGREGFRQVHVLSTPDEVEAAAVERVPLWTNRRHEHGPFDVIGDVHGCRDELLALLDRLGYRVNAETSHVEPPAGRKAVFLGDLVDRGPDSPGVLRLVMGMVRAGTALCIPGNHDVKLLKKLQGRGVAVAHGLAETLDQLGREPPEFVADVREFLDGLVSHFALDDGKLVVAHAGMKAEYQGRASARVRDFALYGETTGEVDEFGLPVRYPWASDYRGRALVVYGHTPVPRPEWLNRTICIDTGCVFGGALTALRYPEMELVSVPAARVYCEPVRPLASPVTALTAQQQADDLLDLADFLGKRIIATRLLGNVTIREGEAAAALEVMSRFAVDPRWLIYLPPTMSPCATSRRPALLEHPDEAFEYYRGEDVRRAVCQQKHMGSRAVVVLGRDAEAVRRRFGVVEGESGIIVTRTGRRFFDDARLEAALLERLRNALTATRFWDEWQTDWACLDCELMPWSAKAQELLRGQYASVGAAARAALADVFDCMVSAGAQPAGLDGLANEFGARREAAGRFVAAYRRYCWPVHSVNDLRLAPFHLLATEGRVHVDRDHFWHMETLAAVCRAGEGLLATPYRVVDLADDASRAAAVRWWEELTDSGGEGMVVKPFDFVAPGKRRLAQPAVKVRGREYLRIIYGPEYTLPGNLERLRQRGLGAKRSLAAREFALGVEALERFVRREPLHRVHECCFGVLALESEPVDPRL
jgi:protein phosphatase